MKYALRLLVRACFWKKVNRKIENSVYRDEKYFEQSIRFADSQEYLDTLSLEYSLCKDFQTFIRCMNSISNNKSFKVPCYCSWDNASKSWTWDYPQWFVPTKFLSLAAWACASIEKWKFGVSERCDKERVVAVAESVESRHTQKLPFCPFAVASGCSRKNKKRVDPQYALASAPRLTFYTGKRAWDRLHTHAQNGD